MKLFYSPTSPYARKARIVIIEHGLQDRVALIVESAMAAGSAAVIGNPLAKVPSLILDNGKSLFDSPVICAYLESLSKPEHGGRADTSHVWDTMRAQALGDGVLDAAFNWVMETKRPAEQQSPLWIERWLGAISRALPEIERDVVASPGPFDIGRITFACALGYLDLRMDHLGWRNDLPQLAGWFDEVSKRPSVIETIPPK